MPSKGGTLARRSTATRIEVRRLGTWLQLAHEMPLVGDEMPARDFADRLWMGKRSSCGGRRPTAGDRNGAELSAVRDDGCGGHSDGGGCRSGARALRLFAPPDRHPEHAVRGADPGAEDGADRPDYFVDDGDGRAAQVD